MADAEPQSNSFNFFGGKKRISKESFRKYLFWAIFIDAAFFWLPGVGTAFIFYCRGLYFIEGYKTDKMVFATLVDAVIELFPFISFFPGCTVFVLLTYLINQRETKDLVAAAEKLKGAKGGAGEEEAKKAAGSAIGKVGGEAVGGPVGAAVGAKLGGAAANRVGGTPGKSIDGIKPDAKSTNDKAPNKKRGEGLRDSRGAPAAKPPQREAGGISSKTQSDQSVNSAANAGSQKPQEKGDDTSPSEREAASDISPQGEETMPQNETKPAYEPRVPIFHPSQLGAGGRESDVDTKRIPTKEREEAAKEKSANISRPTPDSRPAQGRTARQQEGGRNRETAPLANQNYDVRNRLSANPLTPQEVLKAGEILREETLPPEEINEVKKILQKTTLTIEEVTKIRTILRRADGIPEMTVERKITEKSSAATPELESQPN